MLKRKKNKATLFSQDTYMQSELEASFMYEDTIDPKQSYKCHKRRYGKTHPNG